MSTIGGMSKDRLKRIDALLDERYLQGGKYPEALTLVSRKGEVAHCSAQGLMDAERGTYGYCSAPHVRLTSAAGRARCLLSENHWASRYSTTRTRRWWRSTQAFCWSTLEARASLDSR